jgi:hypothetical protein
LAAILLPGWAAAGAPTIGELCGQMGDPFRGIRTPFLPNNSTVEELKRVPEITDDKAKSLKFAQSFCSSRFGDDSCRRDLAEIVQQYHNDELSFTGLQGSCEKIQASVDNCEANQSQVHGCMRELYSGKGDEFSKIVQQLKASEQELNNAYLSQFNAAQKVLNQRSERGPDAEAMAKAFANKVNAGQSRITKSEDLGQCNRVLPSTVFCDRMAIAGDAKYYANQVAEIRKKLENVPNQFLALAENEKKLEEGGGTPGGDPPPGGGSPPPGGGSGSGMLGGMGLDDMLKMATLGMTGAGMYCSITGKCSPKSDSAASGITDPNSGFATSPTPDSVNTSTPGTSPIGSDSLTDNGGTGSSPIDDKASPATAGFQNAGSSAPAGTLALSKDSGGGANHENGRGPSAATSGSVGGSTSPGVGGGSGGSRDSSGASAMGDALHNAGNVDGSLAGLGGGLAGAPSMGAGSGFSLSDSHSPTDAALKGILNGDTPPATDGGLAGLEASLNPEAGAAGGELGALDPSLADSESLFLRIRETHVRCMKRGCVAQGLGDKI